MRNTGLVFSGGGARGAYQAGAWRALRDLKLEPRISVVTGASVGAINGAFFAAGDLEQALNLWGHGDPRQIFTALAENNKHPISQMGLADWIVLFRDWAAHGGLRVDPLRRLLAEQLDEGKIRCSPCTFGMALYNASRRKGAYFWTDDIPKGALPEYVLASAAFPLFAPFYIGHERFLDGGLFDLAPISMALQKPDIQRVIVVDVSVGTRILPRYRLLRRRYRTRLIYLRPSRSLPAPIDFSTAALRRQIMLGYDDACRVLSSLEW